MKNITLSALLLLTALFAGCKEIPPVIGECQTDRVVVIEEFTGVRCVNCPTGSAKIVQLLEQFGERKLIAVSIHSGFFSVPYDISREDFTTQGGEAIDAQLGPVTAYPAASINRKLFPNETQRPLSLSSWAGYIGGELCRAPELNINISKIFDPISRQLTATVDLRAVTTNTIFAEPLGLTVYITENNIISAQLDATGVDTNYVHKHVLRHIMTDTRGLQIHSSGSFSPNSQTLSYTLPAHWDAAQCHIVAFIHYRGANGKFDILQAAETEVE
jgi:hypothetical protein